jgi:hypothetical protein
MGLMWICLEIDSSMVRSDLNAKNIWLSDQDIDYYTSYIQIFKPESKDIRVSHEPTVFSRRYSWDQYYVFSDISGAGRYSRVAFLKGTDFQADYDVHFNSIEEALASVKQEDQITEFLRFLIEDKPKDGTK